MDLPQNWNVLHILSVLIGHHILGHSRGQSAKLLGTDRTTIARCLRPLVDSGLEYHQFASVRFELDSRHYRTVPRLQWFDIKELVSRYSKTVADSTEALLRVIRAYDVDPLLAAKLVYFELENPMPFAQSEQSPPPNQESCVHLLGDSKLSTNTATEQRLPSIGNCSHLASSDMSSTSEGELADLNFDTAVKSSFETQANESVERRCASAKLNRPWKCLRCRDMSRKCNKDPAGCDKCHADKITCEYPAEKNWEYMEDTATTKADLALDTLQVLERFISKKRALTASPQSRNLTQNVDLARKETSKTRVTTSQTTFHQYLKMDKVAKASMRAAECDSLERKCVYCSKSQFRNVHARKYHMLYRCPSNPAAEKNYEERKAARRAGRTDLKSSGNFEPARTIEKPKADFMEKCTPEARIPLVTLTDCETPEDTIDLSSHEPVSLAISPGWKEKADGPLKQLEFQEKSSGHQLELLSRMQVLKEFLSNFDKSITLISDATWRVLPLLTKIDEQNRFPSMEHFLYRRCGLSKGHYATMLKLMFEYIFRTSTTIEAIPVLKMVAWGLNNSYDFVAFLEFLMSQSDKADWSDLVELLLIIELRW